MGSFTPGELLLAAVLGLLSVAFGKWASRLDKVIESMDSIKKEVHDYIVQMERRLTKTEERVRLHSQILSTRTGMHQVIENEEGEDDE